jgi:hypothetical protein
MSSARLRITSYASAAKPEPPAARSTATRAGFEITSSTSSSSSSSPSFVSFFAGSSTGSGAAFCGSRSRQLVGIAPPINCLRNSTMSTARVTLVAPAMALVHARPTWGRRKKPAAKVPATAPKVFTA